jgi:hypothetical protein
MGLFRLVPECPVVFRALDIASPPRQAFVSYMRSRTSTRSCWPRTRPWYSSLTKVTFTPYEMQTRYSIRRTTDASLRSPNLSLSRAGRLGQATGSLGVLEPAAAAAGSRTPSGFVRSHHIPPPHLCQVDSRPL